MKQLSDSISAIVGITLVFALLIILIVKPFGITLNTLETFFTYPLVMIILIVYFICMVVIGDINYYKLRGRMGSLFSITTWVIILSINLKFKVFLLSGYKGLIIFFSIFIFLLILSHLVYRYKKQKLLN